MYYNIKIKSQGSEFILESNDKNVTQREMDIYFALIFNASEEFTSRIKKVEINKDVKSIEEIEKFSSAATKTPQQSLQKEPETAYREPVFKEIKTREPIKQESFVQKENSYIASTPNETPKQTPAAEIKAQECVKFSQPQPPLHFSATEDITSIKPSETIKIQNTTEAIKIAPQEPPIKILEGTDFTYENPAVTETQSELDEIIKLAQNEIDSINIDSNEFDKNILNTIDGKSSPEAEIIEFDIPGLKTQEPKTQEPKTEENPKEHEIYQSNNQAKLDDIFSATAKQNQQNLSFEPQAFNSQYQNTSFEPQTFNSEIYPTTEENNYLKQDFTPAVQNEVLLEPVQIELNETPTLNQNIQEPLMEPAENKEETNESTFKGAFENISPAIEQQTPVNLAQINFDAAQNIKTPEIIQQQSGQNNGPVVDFKLFLAAFAASELIDEFLICAYYIKNILREENFTMKFLNSKLFPATGKIADMSIVEELITKQYLDIIQTQDSIKYCITSDGETYFSNKFQG